LIETLKQLVQRGCRADDILVAIGPHISVRAFEVSPEVAANDEIMELFLPVLRADIGMMERYDQAARPVRLRCPVLACTGSGDPGTSADGLEKWATVTDGQFEVASLPGGHFFMDQKPVEFLAVLAAWIDRQMVKIHGSLKAMSTGLGEKPWCSGNHLSLADIAVGCALGYLDFRFPQIAWRETHPNLAKLAEKLNGRASFADTKPPSA
jgi:hypothetical protein